MPGEDCVPDQNLDLTRRPENMVASKELVEPKGVGGKKSVWRVTPRAAENHCLLLCHDLRGLSSRRQLWEEAKSSLARGSGEVEVVHPVSERHGRLGVLQNDYLVSA